jgi:hypothetical protein
VQASAAVTNAQSISLFFTAGRCDEKLIVRGMFQSPKRNLRRSLETVFPWNISFGSGVVERMMEISRWHLIQFRFSQA